MSQPESSNFFGNLILMWQRRWLPGTAIFLIVFALFAVTGSMKKPIYLAESKLRFHRINTTSSLTGVATEISKLESLNEKNSPLKTESEIIRSLPVVRKVIDRMQLKDQKGQPLKPKDFIKKLGVDDVMGTDIMKVSYTDTNPQRAAMVVNTLIDIYLEHNILANRAEAVAARKFIQQQLPQAEFTVQQAEANLREFKEENKVVDLAQEASRSVEVIADLQKQINQAQSQMAEVQAQSQVIRDKLAMSSQEAVARTTVSQSTGVQDVLKELQQLESQLASKRTVFQDAHPEIVGINNKIDALKALLDKRVEQVGGTNTTALMDTAAVNNTLQVGELKQQLTAKLVDLESNRQGLVNQATTLSNLETNYRRRLNVLPRLEQQQRELERKLQASQSTYSMLLQRLQESRIAENQNIGNVQRVSTAQTPEDPSSSNVGSYINGILMGAIAAIGFIYMLEAKDKSIKNVQQAKELFGLTLLGLIPAFASKKSSKREDAELANHRLVVRDVPRSPISEAYRMLRANLRFLSADKELKVIVVTSSVPQEGKSTVAANLAVALAQMERKVLLVDADLHRPVQHQLWELHNNVGLSNVIVGQSELSAGIKTVMDNLDVLTSGVLPPAPASLLDSRRMAALIESFSANYDYTIIDTPSLNAAADAATLGQMADGVLLVVRPETVDCGNAKVAKELLEKSGQNVLGQVVNAVIPKNEPHSYFYFAQEYYSQETTSSGEVVKANLN
jgi:capsular exopolysaccharide synthesis family protein